MVYFDLIGHLEVINHVATSLVITVVKDIVFGIHIPFDLMYFIGPMRPIPGHYNCTFKFSVNMSLVMSQQSILN